MMRWPPASTRRPGWLRSAEGTLAEVPRKVRSNIVGAVLSVVAANCHGAGAQAYQYRGRTWLPRPHLKNPLNLCSMPTLSSTHSSRQEMVRARIGRSPALVSPRRSRSEELRLRCAIRRSLRRQAPRKVDADAWFDRPCTAQFMVRDQVVRYLTEFPAGSDDLSAL